MARHRTPAGRPWWRRAVTPAVLVGALFVTLWLQQWQTGTDPFNKLTPEVARAPFPSSGAPGQWITARTFDLRVDAVTGAAKLAATANSPARTSEGVFVVVQASIRAHDEPVSLAGWQLRDDTGRHFTPTDRTVQLALLGRAQPGFVRTVPVVFEIPGDVTGLTVLVSQSPAASLRLDSQVQVPLPVTGATVAGWRADPTPVRPPAVRTTVAGPGGS